MKAFCAPTVPKGNVTSVVDAPTPAACIYAGSSCSHPFRNRFYGNTACAITCGMPIPRLVHGGRQVPLLRSTHGNVQRPRRGNRALVARFGRIHGLTPSPCAYCYAHGRTVGVQPDTPPPPREALKCPARSRSGEEWLQRRHGSGFSVRWLGGSALRSPCTTTTVSTHCSRSPSPPSSSSPVSYGCACRPAAANLAAFRLPTDEQQPDLDYS
jgi:hypothetical protein